MILVGSRTSKSKLSANSWSKSCSCSSHSGKLPDWIAFHRSRRWKSGSAPLILTASFQTTDCMPSFGFQMEFDEGGFVLGVDQAEGVDAKTLHEAERARDGAVRHDPHDHVHRFSGVRLMKSQKLSCADCACGKARSGSGFTAWMMSGNLIASWMKNTGMLLPTRSQLPSWV